MCMVMTAHVCRASICKISSNSRSVIPIYLLKCMADSMLQAAAINTVSGVNMTTRRQMLKIKVDAMIKDVAYSRS